MDAAPDARPLLEARGLRVSYGGIAAVRGVSFTVHPGEVVTLIGANGAGKTTILRTLSGLHRPVAGEVWLQGERIDARPPHEIVERGLGHSPEGRRVFARLTVRENLEMGAFSRGREGLDDDFRRVFELFPVLEERRRQQAGTLSGGEQQMLAIGRALMAHPQVLMLDEPSMGLAPMMVERIFGVLRDINAQGTTVLLVEQNAHMALRLANRGYVLETGEIVLEGRADELLGNERVRKAYLGED